MEIKVLFPASDDIRKALLSLELPIAIRKGINGEVIGKANSITIVNEGLEIIAEITDEGIKNEIKETGKCVFIDEDGLIGSATKTDSS